MRLMSDLPSSIATTLRRTHGWLELGCPREATEELDGLPDLLHCSKEVLKLRCDILAASEDWTGLSSLSATSAKYYPSEPAFAEHWTWAEHKQGRTAAAYAILLTAAMSYEKTWRTNYLLACFAYTLRRGEEAAEWLGHAFLLHSAPTALKELALEQFRS